MKKNNLFFILVLITAGCFISCNSDDSSDNIWQNFVEPTGALDESFNVGSGFSGGNVSTLALQADGKILVGGSFTQYNGVDIRGLVRLHPDGSIDNSFNNSSGFLGGSVTTVVPQSDGKILVGGFFTSYNGTEVKGIIRLNADSSLDFSFNTEIDKVLAFAVNYNGKIIAYCSYDNNRSLVCLNSDGTLDQSFVIGGELFVNTSFPIIIVQPDNKIIIGGQFTEYNGVASGNIVRLNSNGSIDTSFNTGIGFDSHYYGVTSISLQPDGKIIATGGISRYNGITQNGFTRLHSDGSLDNYFNRDIFPSSTVFSSALQPNGKVFLHRSGYHSSHSYNEILRVTSQGEIDASFNAVQVEDVRIILVQPDGKVLIAGGFSEANGTSVRGIARLK